MAVATKQTRNLIRPPSLPKKQGGTMLGVPVERLPPYPGQIVPEERKPTPFPTPIPVSPGPVAGPRATPAGQPGPTGPVARPTTAPAGQPAGQAILATQPSGGQPPGELSDEEFWASMVEIDPFQVQDPTTGAVTLQGGLWNMFTGQWATEPEKRRYYRIAAQKEKQPSGGITTLDGQRFLQQPGGALSPLADQEKQTRVILGDFLASLQSQGQQDQARLTQVDQDLQRTQVTLDEAIRVADLKSAITQREKQLELERERNALQRRGMQMNFLIALAQNPAAFHLMGQLGQLGPMLAGLEEPGAPGVAGRPAVAGKTTQLGVWGDRMRNPETGQEKVVESQEGEYWEQQGWEFVGREQVTTTTPGTPAIAGTPGTQRGTAFTTQVQELLGRFTQGIPAELLGGEMPNVQQLAGLLPMQRQIVLANLAARTGQTPESAGARIRAAAPSGLAQPRYAVK